MSEGLPRPVLDSLIVATAAVDDMMLVIRNVLDMRHLDVKLWSLFVKMR